MNKVENSDAVQPSLFEEPVEPIVVEPVVPAEPTTPRRNGGLVAAEARERRQQAIIEVRDGEDLAREQTGIPSVGRVALELQTGAEVDARGLAAARALLKVPSKPASNSAEGAPKKFHDGRERILGKSDASKVQP